MKEAYSVGIDTWAGDLVTPEYVEQCAEEILEQLLKHEDAIGPVVTAGRTAPDGVGVRMTIEGATDPLDAAAHAMRLFEKATIEADLRLGDIARVEVTEEDLLDVEDRAPELVGVSEVGEILGVSRQRISALRTSEFFPKPAAELKSGPVWFLSDLQRFIQDWDRRPGRKKKGEHLMWTAKFQGGPWQGQRKMSGEPPLEVRIPDDEEGAPYKYRLSATVGSWGEDLTVAIYEPGARECPVCGAETDDGVVAPGGTGVIDFTCPNGHTFQAPE